jgi:hypothetical protein
VSSAILAPSGSAQSACHPQGKSTLYQALCAKPGRWAASYVKCFSKVGNFQFRIDLAGWKSRCVCTAIQKSHQREEKVLPTNKAVHIPQPEDQTLRIREACQPLLRGWREGTGAQIAFQKLLKPGDHKQNGSKESVPASCTSSPVPRLGST